MPHADSAILASLKKAEDLVRVERRFAKLVKLEAPDELLEAARRMVQRFHEVVYADPVAITLLPQARMVGAAKEAVVGRVRSLMGSETQLMSILQLLEDVLAYNLHTSKREMEEVGNSVLSDDFLAMSWKTFVRAMPRRGRREMLEAIHDMFRSVARDLEGAASDPLDELYDFSVLDGSDAASREEVPS